MTDFFSVGLKHSSASRAAYARTMAVFNFMFICPIFKSRFSEIFMFDNLFKTAF